MKTELSSPTFKLFIEDVTNGYLLTGIYPIINIQRILISDRAI